MADKKVYSIVINGVQESVNAVESLNKQLSELENRIKALEKSNVKINASSSGGGSTSSGSKSNMDEEAKLAKQIEQIDAKRQAYSKEIYQNYLAAKDVLDETVKDQKQIAASERLQANTYSNTMKGLKQRLKDIQTIRETTDMASDDFKNLTTEANKIANKLKELEEAAGSFGRNVGNYKSATEGLSKYRIEVGGITREFGSAMEAAKTFKKELLNMEKGSQEAEDLHEALLKVKSDIKDLGTSSAIMDNILDTMESLTAIASVGQGLSAFFGIDNEEIQRSIQKLVALQNVLQGIEKIRKQMKTREGLGAIFKEGSKTVDTFVSKITGAKLGIDGLTASSKAATYAVRGLSMALKAIGVGFAIEAITAALAILEKYVKDADKASQASKTLTMSLNTLNKAYETRMGSLAASYLKQEVNENEYLARLYKEQGNYLQQNVRTIERMAQAMNKKSFWDYLNPNTYLNVQGIGYTGTRISGTENKGASEAVNHALWGLGDIDYSKLFKDVKAAEEEWKKLNKAVDDGKDYLDAYGKGLKDAFGSVFLTVEDTRDVMKGIGNAVASDYINRISEAMAKYDNALSELKSGNKSAESDVNKFKKEVDDLYKEMNSSEAYQSFLANIDEYIPDEKFREKIQNMIDGINHFSDSLNESSAEMAHKWMQVRNEGIKNEYQRSIAQLEENERYEIAQEAKTQEQITAIHQKYARLRADLDKQQGNKYREAENDLRRTRIQAMREGEAKELAQLEQEKREKIQKIKDDAILVSERTIAVEEEYQKKVRDIEKKWAAERLKTYEDLYENIEKLNKETFGMEADNASSKKQNRKASSTQIAGQSMITTTNYDDTTSLENYYKRILKIEQDAADDEAKIAQERLDKNIEYDKKEEERRHKRLVDAENGEYKKQLEADKITQEQYNKLIEEEEIAHNSRMNAIDVEYGAKSAEILQKQLDDKQKAYKDYYQKVLSDINRKQGKISSSMSRTPVDKSGFGLNIGQIMKNYDQLKVKQREVIDDIKVKRAELIKNKDKISGEDFLVKQRELDEAEKNAEQTLDDLEEASKDAVSKFVGNLMNIASTALQSVQQIMQAVWDYQDYQFEKEQEELDKWNDELNKKLDEQQDIVQKHKDAIDSIEDELATARGSRREHLIDQLNAEMEAQRAARKQEQKLQKEKEQAEKKQEQLDKKRRKEEYDRNVMQAFVNWHLAIMNGLATQPFLYMGVAMGALATALGAVQYALIKSQKPYARGGQLDGGVAQGNRHRDGGIPVLGGRASIEGGEYITNRVTTSKNVELLDYINSKKKKIDITDLMDFYSTTPRKTIKGVRTKFEDGGYLPTLPNELDIKDQLQNIVVNQDNRPVVVSVVDINNKQEDVRRVQTLAGL